MDSDESSSLTEKLRKENQDQFLILVRMHLSFVLDINTDDVDTSADKPRQFKWGFYKKSKNSNENKIASVNNVKSISNDNQSITEQGIRQVYELIDFLSQEENVTQEGIFRRTGSLSRQQELKQLLLSGCSMELDSGRFSVHDCASVLKGFIAELPEPLLMEQHYQSYCHLAAQCPVSIESSKPRLLTALQLLLMLLPPLHRSFLQRLLRLLRATADREAHNRMSPDTLATMFTPHLLCPRRLAPEALHSDAVTLAPVVSFMIRQVCRLFHTPCKLATDIAAYFSIREKKRLMSPDVDLDESITDRTAANTVYSFVDRHRSTAEHRANPTDTALAQLYAYIQTLPESQHKRRLVKQFNRQNGYGTPRQTQRTSKNLGESIKKHIFFNKGLLNKTPKKLSNHPETLTPLHAHEVSSKNVVLKNLAHQMAKGNIQKSDSDSDGSDDSTLSDGDLLDRTPKLSPKFTSEPNLSIMSKDRDITPKISRSKIFKRNLNDKVAPKREIISSKFSVSSETSNLYTSCVSCTEARDSCSDVDSNSPKKVNTSNGESVAPRRDSMKYITFSKFATPKRDIVEQGLCYKEQNTPNLSVITSKLSYLTSTPAVEIFEDVDEELSCTPVYFQGSFRRASMSPITKSTQKLSKAMQESIMTPRSRKPLIITSEQRDAVISAPSPTQPILCDVALRESLSFKNDSDFISSDESDCSTQLNEVPQKLSNCLSKTCQIISDLSDREKNLRISQQRSTEGSQEIEKSIDASSISNGTSHTSLTEPFREYLLGRSVLTASPVDLSINNHSNEFLDVSHSKMSESLIYCLDGNVPDISAETIKNIDPKLSLEDKTKLSSHDSPNSLTFESKISSYEDMIERREALKDINNILNVSIPKDSTLKISPSRKRTLQRISCDEREIQGDSENDLKKPSMSSKDTNMNKENSTIHCNKSGGSSWETSL